MNELFHVDDHDPAMARKHVEHEIDSAPLDKLELANLERLGRRKKRRILDGTRINLRRRVPEWRHCQTCSSTGSFMRSRKIRHQ